jgi:hypothetical protein
MVTRPPAWTEKNDMGRVSETHHSHLLKEHATKNPPRYDDLAGQNSLSGLPTGRHVLTVLVCIAAVTGFIFLLLTHFQH